MATSNAAVLIGGLAIAGVAAWQFTIASEAKRQVADLKQQLADHQVADLEAFKRSCAEKSAAYFAKLGYDEKGAHDDAMSTFQDHYSQRLHRCLMTIETTSYKPPNPVTTKTLFDADERLTFGNYAWVASSTKKYWEQPPMQCPIIRSGEDERTCRSSDEYDAYVKDMLSS